MAFLSPCSDEHAYDAGYQVCQSLYAIGSGGLLGEGFAKGQQKLFYLPYPYSDFIFAVVGEELGLLGTTLVVLAFAFFLWRGIRAAMFAPDRFGNLLATGIVTSIITQALFNISVTISLLPAKGIPLPFISYGGSSIMVTLISVGVLLSISQHSNVATMKRKTREKRKLAKSAGLNMRSSSNSGGYSWRLERRSQG
jgi:cell division protein FtsW